ncbi:sporulation peptidase YabG [Clostridium botulinum]|uniref:Probable peptidase n=1 Tax=Clostridium botulinum (strain Hall / ATCC 3502 / NCTC 13319 / Type A) TaxID=441771 RepID=A5HY12_CLOBH|nr:sporulation peptidase YabG [Clostridium botulinum]ABS32638.1 sporulation peptidase YabG [Clostridium botulinum A str. ATCC 19397]ABS38351.1 sporulation peptidase YabG [Clostridium botulinum A str. Hall]APQ74584.1 sporulation peptidase YabG [Clostridium botulinum]AUM86279.1 sporulation peptidase YabG [Clostridium botulinum]AUN09094.1 sporulation peptidase YabG [Clostridium botulinum]
MEIGDIVVRKSYKKDITFKIIDIKQEQGREIYTLKGVNVRIIADSPYEDLEEVSVATMTKKEEVFTSKVNDSIKKILDDRKFRGGDKGKHLNKKSKIEKMYRTNKNIKTKELYFGRPGKILHIDGDSEYLDTCLKVYKQLQLDVVGEKVLEKEQPDKILSLVKLYKPDIVVITGHDAVLKEAENYTDINNYRNSKYFVKTVGVLRDYERNYDDLIIFAGACQSCYEAILDAGANYASSPGRVLIHCLDPVFLCEKIAYTNISNIVSIEDALENTITGIKGIGGLQTRGKYREGFPKSEYV